MEGSICCRGVYFSDVFYVLSVIFDEVGLVVVVVVVGYDDRCRLRIMCLWKWICLQVILRIGVNVFGGCINIIGNDDVIFQMMLQIRGRFFEKEM